MMGAQRLSISRVESKLPTNPKPKSPPSGVNLPQGGWRPLRLPTRRSFAHQRIRTKKGRAKATDHLSSQPTPGNGSSNVRYIIERRTSSITHRSRRRLAPVEVGPDIGAAPAARLAHEPRLEIRQPQVIGPAIGAECNVMAATIVGAIDEDTLHAHLAHLAQCDLYRAAVRKRVALMADGSKHAAIKSVAGTTRQIINPLGFAPRASYCASWLWKRKSHRKRNRQRLAAHARRLRR